MHKESTYRIAIATLNDKPSLDLSECSINNSTQRIGTVTTV